MGELGGEDKRLCLPPVFDGGQRLHGTRAQSFFWIELLLRQHELCWRRPEQEDETRIFLLGSSSVFGFPLRADQTFAASINRGFDESGRSAHVYNLAMNFPYQLRDAVILEEARVYRPDVILYPLTLAEFQHHAPVPWRALIDFFYSNHDAGLELLALRPPGLIEPLERYRKVFEAADAGWEPWRQLREIGRFTRVTAGEHALVYAGFLSGKEPAAPVPDEKFPYNCSEVRAKATKHYSNWEQWNVLAFLEWVKERTGAEVAIVHWPISHDPSNDCYNARFTNQQVEEFGDWLHRETRSRNIPLLDLHESLPEELFFDTIHLNERGHRRVGPLIQDFVTSVVEANSREAKPGHPRQELPIAR